MKSIDDIDNETTVDQFKNIGLFYAFHDAIAERGLNVGNGLLKGYIAERYGDRLIYKTSEENIVFIVKALANSGKILEIIKNSLKFNDSSDLFIIKTAIKAGVKYNKLGFYESFTIDFIKDKFLYIQNPQFLKNFHDVNDATTVDEFEFLILRKDGFVPSLEIANALCICRKEHNDLLADHIVNKYTTHMIPFHFTFELGLISFILEKLNSLNKTDTLLNILISELKIDSHKSEFIVRKILGLGAKLNYASLTNFEKVKLANEFNFQVPGEIPRTQKSTHTQNNHNGPARDIPRQNNRHNVIALP